MNVWLKRILFSLVALLLAAVVGLAIFLLTFNPNEYKSRLEQLVFDQYGRTLTIGGDISLSLFPRIGLAVDDVTLSNHKSKDTFISIDSTRFAVAIWPLLSRQLVVDHVAVSGLKAWVVRDKEGQFNFSDLIESNANLATVAATAPAALVPVAAGVQTLLAKPDERRDLNIDIAGLDLKNSQLHYLDQASGLATTFSDIQANTGRVTYDQPFDVSLKAKMAGDDPVQNAQVQAQALLRLDPTQKAYGAQKINVQVTGRLGNFDKLNAVLKGALAYQGNQRQFAANNLELSINGNVIGPHPVQDVKASLTADQLRLDQRNMELKVAKMALRASGQDQGRNLELALDAPALAVSPQSAKADPIAATLKSTGNQTLAVSLGLDGLSGNANEWQFRSVSVDGALNQGQQLLQVKMASPLSWNTMLRKGAFTAIKGDVSVRDQSSKEAVNEFPMIGSLHLDLVRDALDIELNAVLDGSQAALKSTTTRLAQPQTQFSLKVDKLDLNRWMPVPVATTDAAKAPADDQEKGKGDTPAAPAAAPAPAPETPVDLSFLKDKDIQGTVQIGDLRIHDLQITQLEAPVRILDNALSLPKVSAHLYDGTLAGQLRLAADQSLAIKLNLDKLAVGPLLQAALRKNLLSGKGAAQIDLTTQGLTPKRAAATLNGRVAWQVRDGAVQGVDAAQTLTEVAAALGNIVKGRLDAVSSPFDPRRSTTFSTLDGRVDFKNGLGTISKLALNSDLLKVTAGKPATLNVPAQQLDVLLMAQVANRPPKALAGTPGALAGVTFPVRIQGAWDKPRYSVQWDVIRNQTIQRAVKSGLMDLIKGNDPIEQALPQSDSGDAAGSKTPAPQADPVERIGKALKGLLGN
ncbi:AsmA family protein [Castellaniella sp.]|uniref:AsmA family protein n=1 Tax=Castellaniella sp. TaxID=1955812 RepID=UPI003A939D67